MLTHHLLHSYNRKCQRMVLDMAGVTTPHSHNLDVAREVEGKFAKVWSSCSDMEYVTLKSIIACQVNKLSVCCGHCGSSLLSASKYFFLQVYKNVLDIEGAFSSGSCWPVIILSATSSSWATYTILVKSILVL